MVWRPAFQRRRPRARGRARGDRDVRGRPAGHGVRRARRGGLRRPSARPPDHRPRAGDPRHAGRRGSPRSTPPATCPASVVVAAAGLGRPRPDRRSWPSARSAARAGEAAPADEPAPADAGAAVRFQRKDTEQFHVCLGGRRAPARRRAPLRLARARRDLRRALLLAAVPGRARGARAGLRGLLVRRPVRRHRARSGSTSARGRTTSARRWRSSAPSSTRLREQPATEEELERARENVKARVVLALESTGARMNRLGASLLYGLPLLEADEVMARIDAVTLDDLRELTDELWAPERLSAAGIGPDEQAFRAAVEPVSARAPSRRGMIRVAVAGAAGRMGQTVCAAVEARRRPGADRPRRPGARQRRSPTCWATPTCSSTSRSPDTALDNARDGARRRRARRDRHHGLRPRRAARGRRRRGANVFVAPELRDRRGADDALRRRGVAAHGARRDHRAAPHRPSSTRRRARRRARPS